MWSYGTARGRITGRGDNSNTQFALLGLHEAAKAGVNVPRAVWERSRKHFENTQLKDGGWAYRYYSGMVARRGRSPSYGSMTATGVASLFICGQRLHVGGRKVFVRGAYPGCGKYRQNVRIAAGLKWLADNFTVKENPGRGRSWLHYYLYALERCGMITGLRHFGKHDWYRKGAEFLVKTERGGQWGSTYDTAFALLFMAKGNRPVLFQKLEWRVKGIATNEWNRNIHDLENLTNWMGDKLGKRVTWQTTTLQPSLEELRNGPILCITGHVFPSFNAAQKKKLRRFVESGGTLLCEACCGAPGFKIGFKDFVDDVFKDYGGAKKLGRNHPVFSSYYQFGKDFDNLYDLHGIDIGCRTGVFYSPKALSVLWELEDIPEYSDLAFKLGTNIAAYATGREQLRDKLDKVELPPAAKEVERLKEVPRGAIRLARLVHDGDYRADPHALVNLAALLRDSAKVDVVARSRYLQPQDEALYEYPVVFMTGHHSFKYTDEQIAALRKYLDRGGFLFADSCCGRKAFDASFRELVKKLYPKKTFAKLPAKHPIYKGNPGTPLGEVRYRKVLAEELKSRGTTTPPLERIELDGRTVILYSPFDFSCALEGDRPYACRGYMDQGGKRLALNIVLFAIGY
jgi:hypothetical protein